MALCLVCGKEFKVITNTHLESHNMTGLEYSNKFGVKTAWNAKENISSDKLSQNRERFLKIRYSGEPWNKNLGISDSRIASAIEKRNITMIERYGVFSINGGSPKGQKKPLTGLGLKKYFGIHGLTEKQKEALDLGRIKFSNTCSEYPQIFDSVYKKAIKCRDGEVCQICNCQKDKLVIHHIDYNKSNCSWSNLIPLCHSCHGKTNYNRNFYQQVLQDKIRKNGFESGKMIKEIINGGK